MAMSPKVYLLIITNTEGTMHDDKSQYGILATDASLTGARGISENEFFHKKFPGSFQDCNIAQLEMDTVMIAIKTWVP